MTNQPFYRDTWAEVDLDAIYKNVASFNSYLRQGTKIIAVVKANGYGHGGVEVAKAALEAGAERLAVALLDEAIMLREAGIRVPILVLGWVRPHDALIAAENKIALTVYQADWLKEALRYGTGSLNLHLKIDTGMGRIGVKDKKEAEKIIQLIQQQDRFFLEGVYTHFATADEENSSLFDAQQKRFQDWISWLSEQGVHPPVVHVSNSAAAIRIPDRSFHYIRLGISMYGLKPSIDFSLPFSLHEAFSLHSRLIHVKRLEPGETISYGATYTAKKYEWIGTIPIGYADGWIRKLAKSAEVLVGGERAKIVGRICMDMCMIRLSRQMPVGTKVTLIGKQGNDRITVDDIAVQLETINYEIPCMITSRVPRIYIKNKRRIGTSNPVLTVFRKKSPTSTNVSE